MCPKLVKLFAFALVFLTLSACSGGGDSERGVKSDSRAELTVLNTDLNVVTDAQGQGSLNFSIPEGVNVFQLVTFANFEGEVRVIGIKDGSGLVVADLLGNDRLSGASQFQVSPVTLNFPLVANGSVLSAGNYTVDFETRKSAKDSSGAEGVLLSGSLIAKADNDSSSGIVRLNVVYSGLIATDDESRKSISKALTVCGQIASRGGLSLDINEIEFSDGPNVLDNPYYGSPLYEDFANQLELGVNVYFATDVMKLGSSENESGQAGASPGPIIPTAKSAIAISVRRAAGGDGLFNFEERDGFRFVKVDEERILGETVCHELFHYMGLFDSVTFQGSRAINSDLLDSEKCISSQACQENKGANGNIMFPFPIRTDSNDSDRREQRREFFPRDRVSSGQRLEINRWVGVS